MAGSGAEKASSVPSLYRGAPFAQVFQRNFALFFKQYTGFCVLIGLRPRQSISSVSNLLFNFFFFTYIFNRKEIFVFIP